MQRPEGRNELGCLWNRSLRSCHRDRGELRDVAYCEGPVRKLGEEVGLYSECDVKIVEGFEEECDVV